MTNKFKDAIILCGMATFCTLAHFLLIQWLVHLVGHGYKWITVLVACCWIAVFFLLAANFRLHRADRSPDGEEI